MAVSMFRSGNGRNRRDAADERCAVSTTDSKSAGDRYRLSPGGTTVSSDSRCIFFFRKKIIHRGLAHRKRTKLPAAIENFLHNHKFIIIIRARPGHTDTLRTAPRTGGGHDGPAGRSVRRTRKIPSRFYRDFGAATTTTAAADTDCPAAERTRKKNGARVTDARTYADTMNCVMAGNSCAQRRPPSPPEPMCAYSYAAHAATMFFPTFSESGGRPTPFFLPGHRAHDSRPFFGPETGRKPELRPFSSGYCSRTAARRKASAGGRVDRAGRPGNRTTATSARGRRRSAGRSRRTKRENPKSVFTRCPPKHGSIFKLPPVSASTPGIASRNSEGKKHSTSPLPAAVVRRFVPSSLDKRKMHF